MPVIIQGSQENKVDIANLGSYKYDYKYPHGLDISPGSNLHKKLITMLNQYANNSHIAMSPRYESWRKVEETLTVYVNPDTKEEAEEDKTKSEPIVVPITYATLETMLTYMVGAFLDDPLFRYEGRGPEDELSAILLTLLIQLQTQRDKTALGLHTFFRDALVHGFGAGVVEWEVLKRKATRRKRTLLGGYRKYKQDIIIEGNHLSNIDPYAYLPDADFPIHEVQRGRYVGWVERCTINSIITDELVYDDIFNAKYLKHVDSALSKYSTGIAGNSARNTTSGISDTPREAKGLVDIVSMQVSLIPKDMGLGRKSTPEKWEFMMAGDGLILKANPMELDHDMYTVAVTVPDFDGYSISPISKLETIYGLQEVVDWLFKSHIANVKKSINDMLVVDPSVININDLRTPEPGKLVRVRKAAWGRDIGNAVKQLKVDDITRSNVADLGFVIDVIQRATGSVDNLQGIIDRRGERVSATEARGSRSSALSRMERMAKVAGLMGVYDIAYMFASHTQELMSEDVYVKTIGEWETTLKDEYGIEGRQVVSPLDILEDFDIVVRDGSMPGGDFADVWVNLFQVMSQKPEIAAQFDMTRIFKHIARLMGAKNLHEFVRKTPVEVAPMEQIEKQVQRGNLVNAGG